MLIGLIGAKGSGKTTLASYLVERHGFVEKSFADPLKKACQSIFLLSDEQVYGDISSKETPDERWYGTTPRKLLQFVGTELFRNRLSELIPEIGNDIFIHHFRLWYEENKEKNIVVSDVRFLNEMELIKSLGGILIKIFRDKTDETDTHASETELRNVDNCDAFIQNNGTLSELFDSIDGIIIKV